MDDYSHSNLNFNWKSSTSNKKTDWAEKRLIKDLLYDYEKESRPVVDGLTPRVHFTATQVAQQITVEFGLELLQILDLDEMDQILTTSVRSLYKWTDHNLIWNPNDYGGIDSVTIPVEHIWIPDILLYNYADERLDERRPCDARIGSDGSVLWNPMSIFKSTCSVDIKYFPFDRQKCVLKFGPWSYDEKYPDMTFHVWIKRKSAFYTYILIIPSILLSSLTSVIFWLPPHSPSKIVLAMNVFVAFLLLHLLLEDTTPAAASNFPLLGAYYCFNMGVITISMFLCCITVNLHFRTAETEQPPKWLRKFTAFIGWILFINIDALELSEEIMNLKISSCLSESREKSFQKSPSMNTYPKRINHSNIQVNHSLNDLSQSISSNQLNYSVSQSSPSLSAHECPCKKITQQNYFSYNDKCAFYPVQLNVSKSFELHTENNLSIDNYNPSLNQPFIITENIDHKTMKCSECSKLSNNCVCCRSKGICSPICHLNPNDVFLGQNRRQYSVSSNTDASDSPYSLPINICSQDNKIITCQLNESDVENTSLLNHRNIEQHSQYHHHRNHCIEHFTKTSIPFKQKFDGDKMIDEFSKSLYWNQSTYKTKEKALKKNKRNKLLPSSISRLQNYYPFNLGTMSGLSQKNRQSLKRIQKDINYISKAARQLQAELKERDLKERITEQWKIVGIVLDRIFFILYFVTILLSTLLFHPTLIDDYVDD
ncbi:unnamed protein product [Heterobilharzia americana]|nr:unnamed protein product [Heterobilharzia americana]